MVRNACACLCLVLTTVGVYWPVRDYGYIDYDDLGYVAENVQVQRGITADGLAWACTTGTMSNWHPLTWLSHMLDCQLFGHDHPGRHHLTNLLLHVLNALLLFAVLQMMTAAFWRPLLVAAVFALHPLHVESVAWIAERKDVLSTMFWLLSMLSYVVYARRRTWRWYTLAAALLFLGLLAKPMLVTAPCLFLLLDYWPLERVAWAAAAGRTAPRPGAAPPARPDAGLAPGRLVLEKLPMVAIVAASSVVTYLIQDASGAIGNVPLWHRLANAAVSYVRYIDKTLWPVRLAVFYPNEVGMWNRWQVIGAAAVLLAITGLVILLRRKRYLVVGWLWYLGTLVPVIGLVQVGRQALADRYMYMPMTGLLIMIVWGAGDLCQRSALGRKLGPLAAAAVIAACLWLTPLQVATWKDNITLYSHALAVTQRNHVVHVFLGRVLDQEGRTEEAIRHFRTALRIAPGSANAHNDLGVALQAQGHLQEALAHYRRALAIEPDLVTAHNNIGLMLHAQGRAEEAIEHFRQALKAKPDDAESHLNLAYVLAQNQQPEEAAAHYRAALRIEPDSASAHLNLGNVLQMKGQPDQAIEHYRLAVAADATQAEAQSNLGGALLRKGLLDEAIGHLRQAVRLDPKHVAAHVNLGRALAKKGDFDSAVDHLRRALQLDPNNRFARPLLDRMEQSRQRARKAAPAAGE